MKTATPWAIRINVIPYPQFAVLDPNGNTLHCNFHVGRTPNGVTTAFRKAAESYRKNPCAIPEVPAVLANAIPEQVRLKACDPDPVERSCAWRGLLAATRIDDTDLFLLFVREVFAFEKDPLLHLAILSRLAEDRLYDMQLIRGAIAGQNDYVRIEAMWLLCETESPEACTSIAGVIENSLPSKRTSNNQNNCLCAALAAARTLADPAMIPALRMVITQCHSGNMAKGSALDALVAIKRKHGLTPEVRAALLHAKSIYDWRPEDKLTLNNEATW